MRIAAALQAFFAIVVLLAPCPALAAEALDGAKLSWLWALPFAGILICIATGPVLFHHTWERHYGKFALLFAAFVVLPLLIAFDLPVVSTTLSHTLLLEYASFILLLLGVGTLIASVIGTTGASMILIRPLLRANDARRSNVHVVVFFIFLVSNIGGSLSPLGDPPLFLGFLRGVDFFWTTRHLLLETVFVAGCVLAIFAALDIYLHRRDAASAPLRDPTPDAPLRLHGIVNFALIAVIIAAILMSAAWKPGVTFTIFGTTLELQNVLRDGLFIAVTLASLALTKTETRSANGYSWGPIREVAILFAGIFICIAPVMAMLQAGPNGVFAPLLSLITKPDGTPSPLAFFWLTGLLSSFLANAPTYLVFFELAGGDPQNLMTTQAAILRAISGAAVFMGANTYIGNAPNFMVYAVAREAGVRMPSFFGYMLWSGAILLPIFAAAGWLFFR